MNEQAADTIGTLVNQLRERGSIKDMQLIEAADWLERLRTSRDNLAAELEALKPKQCAPVNGRMHIGMRELSPLRRDVADALNRHSAENESDTPDFILAKFLMAVLCAFDAAVNERRAWYGHNK